MTRWFWMTAFAVCVLSFSSLPAWADDPVMWTNAVGVSVSGNSLTKTGSVGWNAGAASLNVIRDGYGFMETTVSEANTDRIIGLSNGDTDQNYSDIDFGFYLGSNSVLYVYEAGVNKANLSWFGTGDRLRITVYDGVVFYLKNGTVVYMSGAIPKYPLRVDTAIYSPGGTLTNVRVGNLVWTNGVGVSITGDSLTKTGSAGWNAGASSTNTIESGDGYVEFTATETNTNRAAGLGNGDPNQTLADIEFGIVLHTDASVEISESGTSRGTFGSYASGDLFRVELSQGTVRYYQNGSNFYTSTVSPAYPLRADTSFDTAGGTISNLRLETTLWGTNTGVSILGAKVTKTSGTNNWDSGASSSNLINSGDGYVEFTAIETNTQRALGLKGTGAATTYADIDFAINLTDSGNIQIYELGTLCGNFGSYSFGDRLRVEIQDGIVKYRKNGAVIYTSAVAPTYPLHAEASFYTNGATVAEVALGDLVWINETRVVVSGRSVIANASVSGWDAGATSTKTPDTWSSQSYRY